MKRHELFAGIFLLVVAAAILQISCSPRRGRRTTEGPGEIILSGQHGLAYAPFTAARLKGWFEEEIPGATFRWKTLGNATAIREAMLANRLDGGVMGIPPFLIGRDRGMEWTAVVSVAEAELGLNTRRDSVESIADIPPDLRIALPQPGSIQHILLAMAAEREFGDAGRFDNQLVTLSHPDGMNALLAGSEVEAHFTSPPFLQDERRREGIRTILDGQEAFGGRYSFIVAVLSDDFIDRYPEAAEGFRRAIERGARWLNEQPDEAAVFLADHYGLEPEVLRSYLDSCGLVFGGEIRGMDRFRTFMHAQGYLNSDLEGHDLVLP